MAVPQRAPTLRRRSGSARALFVDFDGSLAPIVLDPAAAAPLPAARAALARLVPVLARVAVVSGRPAAFLRDALAIDGLDYAGTYGLERIVAGEVTVDERVRPFVDAVARAADEAEAVLPGLLVERKGEVAVTVHWRDQPERGVDATRWAAEAAPRLGLEAPLRGRMAVELRPPVPVDKGTTVAELARGMRTAAFAGDDAGDLPAFAALRVAGRRRLARTRGEHRRRVGREPVRRCARPTSWSRGRRAWRRCSTRSPTRSPARLLGLVEQLVEPGARRVHRGEVAQARGSLGALVVRHRQRRCATRARPPRCRRGARGPRRRAAPRRHPPPVTAPRRRRAG